MLPSAGVGTRCCCCWRVALSNEGVGCDTDRGTCGKIGEEFTGDEGAELNDAASGESSPPGGAEAEEMTGGAGDAPGVGLG